MPLQLYYTFHRNLANTKLRITSNENFVLLVTQNYSQNKDVAMHSWQLFAYLADIVAYSPTNPKL
jgi:hypothetical protein